MSLHYAEYDSTNNKTLKNRKNNREKISNLRSSLKKSQDSISAMNEEPLADFNPLPPPRLSSTVQSDKVVTKDIDLNTNQGAEDYYKQYTNMYTAPQLPVQQQQVGNDSLITKLNYVIHLLEEQQDQKTGCVTEEIILYAFLGVFIIFIVDSFARAGKYVR